MHKKLLYKEIFNFLESIWDPKGRNIGAKDRDELENVSPILSHVGNKIDICAFLTQIPQNAITKN